MGNMKAVSVQSHSENVLMNERHSFFSVQMISDSPNIMGKKETYLIILQT